MSRTDLDKVKGWCQNRAFTIPELQMYMINISGVKLGLPRVRHYVRVWCCSTKKTSFMHIRRTAIGDVELWKQNITEKVTWYAKRGYVIATQGICGILCVIQ